MIVWVQNGCVSIVHPQDCGCPCSASRERIVWLITHLGKDEHLKLKVQFLLNVYCFYTIVKLKNPELNHPKSGTSCSSMEHLWSMADSQANPQCTAFVHCHESHGAPVPGPRKEETGARRTWGRSRTCGGVCGCVCVRARVTEGDDVGEITHTCVCVCVCARARMCDSGGRRTRWGTSHWANNSCNSWRQGFSNHLWWRTRHLNSQFIRDWCFCKSNCYVCVCIYFIKM